MRHLTLALASAAILASCTEPTQTEIPPNPTETHTPSAEPVTPTETHTPSATEAPSPTPLGTAGTPVGEVTVLPDLTPGSQPYYFCGRVRADVSGAKIRLSRSLVNWQYIYAPREYLCIYGLDWSVDGVAIFDTPAYQMPDTYSCLFETPGLQNLCHFWLYTDPELTYVIAGWLVEPQPDYCLPSPLGDNQVEWVCQPPLE